MTSIYRPRPTLRDRLSAIALSLVAVALLVFLLLRLGILPTLPPRERATSFALFPAGEEPAAQQKQQSARKPRAADVRPAAVPRPPPPPRVTVPAKLPAVTLSHDEFAATDIGAMTRSPGAGDGDDAGPDSVAAYGPGQGPGGKPLYKAEWYREPPPNALALYLPGGPQPGWALIACRTVEKYKVENCRELDESPRGSGLARALRQAAWQFQVRPPRLGGKPLIGAWVSIRFDFTENRPG